MIKIESYEFGQIVINGETYTSDVIVFPNEVRDKWWRKEGHRLDVEDIEEVLKFKPAVLIVGTGYYGCMEVPDSTKRYLEMKRIKLIEARTAEAVELYNNLSGREKVVAALHLTC